MLLFAGHFLTIVLMFGLLAIYEVHLFRTDRIPQDKKPPWAVELFLGNMVAMPISFDLDVWKEPRPLVPSRPPS